MRRIDTKILIIGAGPAGAMAALFLSKKNINCLLVDKAKFPRDKICGDALSGKVVEILKRYEPSFIDQLVQSDIQVGAYGVNFIAPNNKWLRVPFKQNYAALERAPGFVSKRIDFDNFLIEEVRKKENIEFVENTELRIFEKIEDGYLCYNADKSIEIRTKVVIACDGASSSFAKQGNNFSISNKENCYGLRAYYKGIRGLDKDNFIELHFIKELLPGYFWIFPLPNGEANIGLGIRADVVTKKKLKLPHLLEKVLSMPQFKDRFKEANLIDKIQLHALPMGTKQRQLHGDNFLLAGDAAALIDPFTGEGIGNAMMSALCAAETVENAILEKDYSANLLSTYDQKVYKRLGPELQMSTNLQKLVMYPRLFNYVVNKATNNTELQNLISTMFEDIDLRAKFKDPKFYFKLLFN
jgi:menaquinone-9 beta-reductase